MFDLFLMGGPLFMGVLSLIFVVMLIVATTNGVQVFKKRETNSNYNKQKLGYIKSVGLFALVIGILGQLIGLFSAFEAMEVGNVSISPAMLYGGFKVSMISTIYGMLIYATSIILWLILSYAADSRLGKA